MARGGEPVVSVSGDGGFVMTAQELATAARYRLRVLALVHNDSAYGAIKNIQQRNHEGRYLDTDLNNPDFLSLAAAYGVSGQRVRTADELGSAVRAAIDRDGPTLIEVPDQWRFLRDLANPHHSERLGQSAVGALSPCACRPHPRQVFGRGNGEPADRSSVGDHRDLGRSSAAIGDPARAGPRRFGAQAGKHHHRAARCPRAGPGRDDRRVWMGVGVSRHAERGRAKLDRQRFGQPGGQAIRRRPADEQNVGIRELARRSRRSQP